MRAVVAGINISAARFKFFNPIVVAITASASPTASVSSPGSAPFDSCVEKRSHGVASCSRAHVSSVFFSSSGVFAPGIGA